jgi:2-polyprenyl-3-methyl-5-hydroxy-6-metoxy-1,4-benzoquinol methylase
VRLPYIAMKHLDLFSTEQLRAQVAASGGDVNAVEPVDYVVEGEDYRAAIGDERFDFIIANHVMQRIIDPITWLQQLAEMLTPGGHLLLSLPDKKYSFDRFRDDTSIAHLIADYLSPRPLAERGREHAIETHIFYDRSFINKIASPDEIFDAAWLRREAHHSGIHCHVFQPETFLARILKPLLYSKLIDFTLVEFSEKSPYGEFYVVLRKGWEPLEFSLDEFYVSARAADAEKARQLALIAAHKGYPAPAAPALQDLPKGSMIAWRREVLARCGGLRGVGMEVGAATRPTVANGDSGVEMKYLDFYSTEELQAHVAKNGGDPNLVVPIEFVAAGEDYRSCVNRRFDFIIANHVMEHIIDPVAWLEMLSELLNPDGHLLLTLPDKKGSFDHYRDDTSVAHLLADYLSDAPLEEKARLHAAETYLYYDRNYIKRTATVDDIFNIERLRAEKHHPGVHCHVFQGETFLQRIMKPLLYTRILDYTLVDFVERSPWGEFNIVLKKGWAPFAYSLDELYQCSRAEAEADAARAKMAREIEARLPSIA